MSITQDVFKIERIVPLLAKRAINGEPDSTHPDVDDRGFLTPEFGPVVSVTKGKTVTVRLSRRKLDDAAPLTAVSSDTSVFSIADPADGKLPNTTDMDIQITGVDGGGDSKTEKLQVKFQEFIIFELHVTVFKEVDVDVTPHVVTINGGGTTGTVPVANIAAIMGKVQDIWGHYGIKINVKATRPNTVTFGTVNSVNSNPFNASGEVSQLLATDHVPKTINAYFVGQIAGAAPGLITLGLGISRQTATANHLSNPGIILADGGPGFTRSYVMFWANDLAHEIGHFFTLQHVENAQIPNDRQDSWSRRQLMQNRNELAGVSPFPATNLNNRPRFDDAGYGLGQGGPAAHHRGRRGCMVTLKHLPQLHFDAEATTSRATINSPAGPY
jgi:hypothetical protein